MTDFSGRIGHVWGIESPWGNAGGVVKSVEDVEKMAHTGVGWIEAGSYTLEMRKGNQWNPDTQAFEPDWNTYDHDPETGLTHNSLGMPNKGMDAVELEIPEMARIARAFGKVLAVNVAPVSNEPVAETVELASRAYAAGADTVIVNAGCPNVKDPNGEQHKLLSRSPDDFAEVLIGLMEAKLPHSVWVRVSPQENYAATTLIADYMSQSMVVSAVLTPNTWPVPMPHDEAGKPVLGVPMSSVGRSGPGVRGDALSQMQWMRIALHKGIDIIGSSGITDARALRQQLSLGAVAGAGTTFYYESPDWKASTDKLLYELANYPEGRLLGDIFGRPSDNS